MTVVELLEATYDRLSRDGVWHQVPQNEDEECLVIAGHKARCEAMHAEFDRTNSFVVTYGYDWGVVEQHARDAVEKQIKLLFPGRGRCNHAFNDHPDTTLEDVLLVLKHAIAAEQEKENDNAAES